MKLAPRPKPKRPAPLPRLPSPAAAALMAAPPPPTLMEAPAARAGSVARRPSSVPASPLPFKTIDLGLIRRR